MYSDDELLTELRRLADSLGRPPTLQDVRDKGAYAAMTYYNRFGSWREALESAGFQPREPESKIPREDLLEELRRLADGQDNPPTAMDMNDHGAYWASTYRRRFGSWRDAIEAADLTPRRSTVTDADLLAELRRLADNQDGPPTYTEMENRGAHGASTYVRRFGSWNSALEAAGLTSRTSSDLSQADLLEELHRLADELGHRPSAREMDERGAYASATYQRHFDSWSTALETAFED